MDAHPIDALPNPAMPPNAESPSLTPKNTNPAQGNLTADQLTHIGRRLSEQFNTRQLSDNDDAASWMTVSTHESLKLAYRHSWTKADLRMKWTGGCLREKCRFAGARLRDYFWVCRRCAWRVCGRCKKEVMRDQAWRGRATAFAGKGIMRW